MMCWRFCGLEWKALAIWNGSTVCWALIRDNKLVFIVREKVILTRHISLIYSIRFYSCNNSSTTTVFKKLSIYGLSGVPPGVALPFIIIIFMFLN